MQHYDKQDHQEVAEVDQAVQEAQVGQEVAQQGKDLSSQ
jgi:hypothetical protein